DSPAKGPSVTSRNLAIVQAAVYDAVNSIDHTYASYSMDVPVRPGASLEAAAAAAAHDTLTALYPAQQATFDRALAATMGALAAGPSRDAGLAVGQLVA